MYCYWLMFLKILDRKTCITYYDLDPANYISAPGLSWDAMLLKTSIKLELMHDLKVLEIMERHKKGGLVFVGSKRHVVANNKYMDNYDKDKESNYILYLDANNLYGTVMTQSLPYDEIKIDNTLDIKNVLETDDNNDDLVYEAARSNSPAAAAAAASSCQSELVVATVHGSVQPASHLRPQQWAVTDCRQPAIHATVSTREKAQAGTT